MTNGTERAVNVIDSGGRALLHLTMATTDYDHVRDLTNGVVRADGIALTGLTLGVEEIFFRFIKNREWDVSEMSFGKFIGYASQGNSPFIGLPVFPSRVFRQSAFYVRADRGIKSPKDLEGKRVGIPEWGQTAGIFARGYLTEAAGIDLAKIAWVQAGTNEPGRDEKVAFTLPPGVKYEQRRDSSITAMLLSGEIDAAIAAHEPDAVRLGQGKIVRLFPDFRREEARYYAETGIFPIMHVIAIRRAVFERYPWVARNLVKAFEEAKQRSLERLRDLTAPRIPVPWSSSVLADCGEAFGDDPFPYGLERNRTTLEAFCRFAHAQGLTAQRMTVDDLFPPEVRAESKV
jgi:4,5-dihydroxyphthalate decarboxylase